jgi:hypothetical protein
MLRWMTLALLALALPAFADRPRNALQTGEVPPEDQKAVHDFKLNSSSFNKLLAAGQKIRALAEKDPSMEKANPMRGGKNFDESVKLVEQLPQLVAALKSVGLSPREFIVGITTFSISGMWAAMKNADPPQRPPSYMNPDNIKFVEDHPDALEKFGAAWGAEGKSRPRGGRPP